MQGITGAGAQPWLLEQPQAATAEDIFYCFRLILGRAPNREEWPGHSARAGEDLTRVVASYTTSLEFARRGLLDPARLGDVTLSELPQFRIFVDAQDAAVGRHVQQDNYEPEVTAVFRSILRPGMGVVDLGANIGYFTMLSAAIVGSDGYVLAVEPNPRNARMLEVSRRANDFRHVIVSQTAAGAQTGLLSLHTSYSNGTTSGLAADVASILAAETVPCIRPDVLVPPGRRIDLIKADVEGAEYLALLGCEDIIRRWRPTIISEFSPNQMPGISGVSGAHYLNWLVGLGYALSIIRPDGSLEYCGADAARVLQRHVDRGVDHVDIVAKAHGAA